MRLNHADAKSNREPESPCDGAEKPDRACPVASYREGGSDSLNQTADSKFRLHPLTADSPHILAAAFWR